MSNWPSTIGLEFESIINTREHISELLPYDFSNGDHPIYAVTRDASVEAKYLQVGKNTSIYLGRQSLRNGVKKKSPPYTGGFEIVTKPLSKTEMRDTICKIVNAISRGGEIFSPRSSIHVHIGYPRGFIFLKTAMALGLKVESLMYKIAGMGMHYRGETNRSAYARALANPPVVRATNSKLYLLDPAGARDSSNMMDFWQKLGLDYRIEHNRYTPLRYFGLNIYSVLLRGTMEWRYFNFSFSPKKVQAVTSLCQFITDLMVRVPLDVIEGLPNISIFSKNSNASYIELLNELISLGDLYRSEFDMSPMDIRLIEDLIYETPQPVFEKKNILTHLDSYVIDHRRAAGYKLKEVSKADAPGIISIHNFETLNHSLIGG